MGNASGWLRRRRKPAPGARRTRGHPGRGRDGAAVRWRARGAAYQRLPESPPAAFPLPVSLRPGSPLGPWTARPEPVLPALRRPRSLSKGAAERSLPKGREGSHVRRVVAESPGRDEGKVMTRRKAGLVAGGGGQILDYA